MDSVNRTLCPYTWSIPVGTRGDLLVLELLAAALGILPDDRPAPERPARRVTDRLSVESDQGDRPT